MQLLPCLLEKMPKILRDYESWLKHLIIVMISETFHSRIKKPDENSRWSIFFDNAVETQCQLCDYFTKYRSFVKCLAKSPQCCINAVWANILLSFGMLPASIYLFKVNLNTRKRCEKHQNDSVFFFSLWAYFINVSSVSIVDTEQVNVSWVV